MRSLQIFKTLTKGMTSGDFTMYIAFTIFMVIPIVDLANIGTQITEAFAGLDRISEIFAMKTENDEDANKQRFAENRRHD